MMPLKLVGSGLPVQFFYYNMRLLGAGLKSDPDISLPYVALWNTTGMLKEKLGQLLGMASSLAMQSSALTEKSNLATTPAPLGELINAPAQVVQPV